MGTDDRQGRRLSRLALKVGKVATAAAALLAENAGGAHEGDLLSGLLNRNDMAASVTREREEPGRLVPPPLILQPGQADPDRLLVGHRSHSSHSSHRSHSSHVSGSSHASHFSSSVGTGSGYRSSSGSSRSSPSSFEPSSSSSPDEVNPSPTPGRSKRPAPPPRVAPQPARKAEISPDVYRSNPSLRYRLIALGTYSGIQKAYIKDQLLDEAKLIEMGEVIGDCRLVGISLKDKSVRLKPPKGPDITINHTAR